MNNKIFEPIDLSDLIEAEQLKTTESLVASIEAYQKRIVSNLTGSGFLWKRAATYSRTLVTKLGSVDLRIVKLKRKNGPAGEVTSPILDALCIRRQKYSPDVRMILADMAARLSYDDSRKQFREITGIEIPKRTIHSFVQEIGKRLKEEAIATEEIYQRQQPPLIAVLADGTKTRSVYPTPNNVKVAMKYDQLTKEKRLVSIGVNNGWNDANGKTPKNTVIVSDAEEEIPDSITHAEARSGACGEGFSLPNVDGRS